MTDTSRSLSSEGWKSKVKGLADLVLAEDWWKAIISLCSHMTLPLSVWGTSELHSFCLLTRIQIPLWGVYSDVITSQRPQLPRTITSGLKASIYGFWQDTNISSMTLKMKNCLKIVVDLYSKGCSKDIIKIPLEEFTLNDGIIQCPQIKLDQIKIHNPVS